MKETKGYDVIGVNVFHFTLMRSHFTKEVNSVPIILLRLSTEFSLKEVPVRCFLLCWSDSELNAKAPDNFGY